MSFMNSLRTHAAGFVNSVSPIKLFQVQQAKKLGAELSGMAFPRARNAAERWAAIKTMSPTTEQKVSSWWAGNYLDSSAGMMGKASYKNIAAKNALIRRTSVGLLGAATIGTMVYGRDNLFSEVGGVGVKAGAVGLGAASMAEWGAKTGNPLGGIGAAGLIGWTALSMFNR